MANKQIIQQIKKIGSDWLGEQVVRLGDYSEEVETGTPGEYYAREINGRVIRVVNSARISPRFDLRVVVRRSKIQPSIWQITEVLQDYPDPAEAGRIAHHREQHEEEGDDRLHLDRKQIKQLTCRVSGTWRVRVYGGTVITPAGIVAINTQEIDLSSYVVTTGAKFITIQTDEDGLLSVVDGTPFGSPMIGTAANIPEPDSGEFMIAFVLFYEGQTALEDRNIGVPMALPVSPGTGGGVSFDDTEGDPEDVSEVAPADGTSTFAARRDHVHLYTPGESEGGGGPGHDHGLMRWDGASGQTIFILPDLARYVESLMLNGLEEDPLVYSLSSDGSQIVLDTGLASAQNVISHYVIMTIEV
jgi:hypothetical protein